MANTKREKLFAEFPPVPTEKWEEVIAVDLKGADYERKLVWRTPEGFNVRPYYRAENLEGLKFLASEPGEFPYVRGTRCDNVWRVHQSLTVKCPEAANAEALKLLDSGVDSLGFSLTKELSAAEVETLLRDIHLPAVEVIFSGEGVADVVEPVLAKIERRAGRRPLPCTSCSIRSSTVCRSPARSARPAGRSASRCWPVWCAVRPR